MVDRIREQRYAETRGGLDFADLHRRTRDHDPGVGQILLRGVAWPFCKGIWRMRHEGRENIPGQGAVIIAANHASFLDHFFIGLGIPRPVNFMAKSQLFNRASRTLISVLGAYPVIRGGHDEDAHLTSLAVLARGGVVIMYPQGGRSRTDEFGGRARLGVARLAYETGAPILPTAVVGSAHVREWRRGRFPQVTVRYGMPFVMEPDPAPTRDKQQALADETMAIVRRLYEDAG